jgi:single-strand DNA-binding protein
MSLTCATAGRRAARQCFAGNLTDDPELRHTEGGIARAMFRVAVSACREQEASFFTVVVCRVQAKHAAQSLAKGSRVVVMGRLQQRSWTAEDGSVRSAVEVVADELGPSLRWAEPSLGDGDDDQDHAQLAATMPSRKPRVVLDTDVAPSFGVEARSIEPTEARLEFGHG